MKLLLTGTGHAQHRKLIYSSNNTQDELTYLNAAERGVNVALKCIFEAFSKNRPYFNMFTCISWGEKSVISSSDIYIYIYIVTQGCLE